MPAMPAILTLADIEDLAHAALAEHGLDEAGWTFRWDNAKRRLGSCTHARKEITLSRPIFAKEANRDDALDTILHEVAHALLPVFVGHGARWRAKALELGARPEACATVVDRPDYLWVAECDCDATHGFHRRPKVARRCVNTGLLLVYVNHKTGERWASDYMDIPNRAITSLLIKGAIG